jgi:predicted permease
MALWSKLRNLLRGERHESELDEEMRFHLEMRREENVKAGMREEDAAREARVRFGNATLLREEARDASIVQWLDGLAQDARYTMRSLRSGWTVSAMVVTVLALGIGANTAIFRVTHALLLRSLPVRDAGGLVNLRLGNFMSWGYVEADETLTIAQWRELTSRQTSLEEMFAYADASFDVKLAGGMKETPGAFATGEMFSSLGVTAAAGRLLEGEDDFAGGTPVVAISHALWEREFGRDAAVVGRTLFMEGKPFTVVGVAPPRFYGLMVGRRADVYVPMAFEPYVRGKDSATANPLRYCLHVFGRLRPGVTFAQANAQAGAISEGAMKATLPLQLPETARPDYVKQRFMLKPGATGISSMGQALALPMKVLTGIVALLLLLAAFTVANLLTARAAARQKELAMRVALGASRWRVFRQLCLESATLALLGAAAGLALSQAMLAVLLRRATVFGAPLRVDTTADWTVFGFACAAAAACALVFGIAPAMRAAHILPSDAFKGTNMTPVRRVMRLRQGLLAGQIAVTVVLIASAVLFAATLRNLLKSERGLSGKSVAVATIDMRRMEVPAEALPQWYARLLDKVRSLPGVESAALSVVTPISGSSWQFNVKTESGQGLKETHIHYNAVTPEFLATFGTRLLAGRGVSERDKKGGPAAVLVNAEFARKAFGGETAIGKRVTTVPPDKPGRSMEIVGVVEDAKYANLRMEVPPTLYEPFWQLEELPGFVSVSAKSARDEAALAAELSRWLGREYPNLSYRVRPFEEQVEETLSQERVFATICVLFGGLALCLAAVGMYGVLSYAVEQRRPEFGIRMTLGATPGNVRRLIYRQGGAALAAGSVAGCVCAVWGGRFVRILLFGVTEADAGVYGVVVGVVALVVGLAAAGPAVRASRGEVMGSLRGE